MPSEQASQNIPSVPLRSWSNQSDFKIKELLTKGSYGKVYLASHVNTGRDLIVKVSNRQLPCSSILRLATPACVHCTECESDSRDASAGWLVVVAACTAAAALAWARWGGGQLDISADPCSSIQNQALLARNYQSRVWHAVERLHRP